uniref:Sulfur globule protein CV1 n=1 Tax=Candidatus Kentrum sp. LFY TaxID=2126342 RepID=A0A450WWV8_9GAMM|nr:MAG: hypothetical protein BECKLFY1418C_GA0070996_10957 [Candidatus Kentron sp. LFY]
MKLVSKTLAAALIAGASALTMQAANAFWMTPDGYGSFGPWNWGEHGMSNRGGPWGGGGYGYGGGGYYGGGYGGAPYGGGYGGYHGYPYGGGYAAPYGYGFPAPAYPPQAPAPKKD